MSLTKVPSSMTSFEGTTFNGEVRSYDSVDQANFVGGASGTANRIQICGASHPNTPNVITMDTNGSEKFRIDSSGNLLVGTTSNARGNRLLVNGTSLGATPVISISSNYNQYGLDVNGAGGVRSDGSYLSFETVATSGDRSIYFSAGKSGGVYLIAGATSWTSSSDERVKDIIGPITNATEKVSSLRAVIGKYKTDEEGTRRSFLIAQDVQAVLPEAVNVQNDEQGTLGLQYTDVIPLLVAAIK